MVGSWGLRYIYVIFPRLGMKLAFRRAGKYESIDLISDIRQYSIPEIIEHFGVHTEAIS